MKKFILGSLTLLSLSALAATPEFDQLSKSDVEKLGNEFGTNFSHSTVSAPETEGLWGVEVGVVAGQTNTPHLKKVVEDANGSGSDFKNLYNAALIARAHFPLDLFAEMSLLPNREISDVQVKSHSFGVGWNLGGFFNLPLDLAIGANFSNADVSFDQQIQNASTGGIAVDSTINIKSKTRVLYVGVSKRLAFFTPYAKFGVAKIDSDVNVDATAGTIFTGTSSQSQSVSKSGGYAALGANLSFFFFRLGVEGSQTNTVKRVSAKFSFDF
jgi:hypothetical protein